MATEVAKFVLAHPEKEALDAPPKDKKLGFTLSNTFDPSASHYDTPNLWKNFSADDPVQFLLHYYFFFLNTLH